MGIMPLVGLDEWVPDQVMWNNRALINAHNVIPTPLGYSPIQTLAAATSAFDTERVRGCKTFRQTTARLHTIAGSREFLKKYDPATTGWTDISDETYGTDPEFGFWSMCQYGTLAIMTNLANNVKKYDISTTPATVSDLGGTPPKAMHCMTVKDNLVLANLQGLPNRAQWSDLFDPEDWSTGVSDFQDFPDGGRIMSVMGGEIGYFFQERTIRAMQFTPGASSAFQIDPVDQDRGSAAYQGLVAAGNIGFYLAHDGFFHFNSGRSSPIGTDRVDTWFIDNALNALVTRTIAGMDPKKKLIYWAFISVDNTDASATDAICDRLLIYHWPSKRFAWATIRVSAFADFAQPGTTLDQLGNIDTLPFSMDSLVYNADSISSIAGFFSNDFCLNFMGGANMEATFEVERLEFFPPFRQYIRGFWPVTDADDVQIAVAPRESINATEAFGSDVDMEDHGFVPCDSSARMHDIRMTIPEDTTWTHARGVHVDVIPDGEL
jgi:hypothetical protein